MVEDLDHALVKCNEVRLLWKRIGEWWKRNMGDIGTVGQLLQEDAERLKSSKGKSLWTSVKWSYLYLIWGHRNSLVFKGERKA